MGIYPFPDGDVRDFDKVFNTLIEVRTFKALYLIQIATNMPTRVI